MTGTVPYQRGDLCYAVRGGNLRRVEDLLKQGVDPDERDAANMPPMTYAMSQSLEMVELLVKYHADVNVPTIAGDRPLKGCIAAMNVSAYADAQKIFHFMLEHGARIDAIDAKGTSAQQWARQMNNDYAVEVLEDLPRLQAEQAAQQAALAQAEVFHQIALKRQDYLKTIRVRPAMKP